MDILSLILPKDVLQYVIVPYIRRIEYKKIYSISRSGLGTREYDHILYNRVYYKHKLYFTVYGATNNRIIYDTKTNLKEIFNDSGIQINENCYHEFDVNKSVSRLYINGKKYTLPLINNIEIQDDRIYVIHYPISAMKFNASVEDMKFTYLTIYDANTLNEIKKINILSDEIEDNYRIGITNTHIVVISNEGDIIKFYNKNTFERDLKFKNITNKIKGRCQLIHNKYLYSIYNYNVYVYLIKNYKLKKIKKIHIEDNIRQIYISGKYLLVNCTFMTYIYKIKEYYM